MKSTIKQINADLPKETIKSYANNETTSSISLYLKEIGKYPVLTPDEEKKLAKRIANGDKIAREEFINSNLRLVVHIAKKYRNVKLDLDLLDLIQEGNLGLLKAVEMFDYTKNIKFSTYATWWIKRTILRAMVNNGDVIRLPVHLKERVLKYQVFQNNFYKNNGREATYIEVAEAMRLSQEEVKKIEAYVYHTISLNLPVKFEDDSGDELGDFIKDNNLTPEELSIRKSNREFLDVLISKSHLSEMETVVLKMRYDTDNDELKTLEYVAKKVGKSKERIRQIESKAIKKMKVRALIDEKRY